MILIEIIGGTKTQRDTAEDMIRYTLKKLLPKKRSLEIQINIKDTLVQEAVGFCEKISLKEYKIELYNRGDLYQYLTTIAHELIHLKQYRLQELEDTDSRTLWKGVDKSHLSYKDQPWEREAWKDSIPIAKSFIQEVLNLTIVGAKTLSPRTMCSFDPKKELIHIQRTNKKISDLNEKS